MTGNNDSVILDILCLGNTWERRRYIATNLNVQCLHN